MGGRIVDVTGLSFYFWILPPVLRNPTCAWSADLWEGHQPGMPKRAPPGCDGGGGVMCGGRSRWHVNWVVTGKVTSANSSGTELYGNASKIVQWPQGIRLSILLREFASLCQQSSGRCFAERDYRDRKCCGASRSHARGACSPFRAIVSGMY